MNGPGPSERQSRILWAALTGLAVALIVALLAAAVWGLGQVLRMLGPVVWPLAVAGVLAYLLDPVVDWFQRRKMTRTRAIICVFAVAFFIVTALAAGIVPQIVSESRDLATRIPTYSKRVEQRVQDWIDHPPAIVTRFLKREELPISTNAVPAELNTTNAPAAGSANTPAGPVTVTGHALDKQTLQNAATWVAQALPRIGSWLFGQVGRVASWFGAIAGIALIPVYLFYFLLEKRGISSNWTDYLPVKDSQFKTEVVFVLNAINDHLIAFFRGQVLVAICDGILYTIGFLIIGLPYAVLIGAVATCLTIIPFLGAIVTCVTALVIALVQFGDWQHPAMVLAVFAVVQSIEGLVISPKIMGDRTGLHPVVIIIAVMTGTTLLGGLLGGILAIPLAAAGKVIMFRYVWKKRDT